MPRGQMGGRGTASINLRPGDKKPYNFTHCMQVEPRSVHSAEFKESTQRCADRSWQSLCAPPCTRIDVVEQTRQTTPREKICARKDMKHALPPQGAWWPDPAPWKTLIEKAHSGWAHVGTGGPAQDYAGRPVAARWRGKVLRARFWRRDGFWVRAQLVLKQARLSANISA